MAAECHRNDPATTLYFLSQSGSPAAVWEIARSARRRGDWRRLAHRQSPCYAWRKAREKIMPRYVVDHYWTKDGEIQVDPGPTFDAENDADAWQKANEWSA